MHISDIFFKNIVELSFTCARFDVTKSLIGFAIDFSERLINFDIPPNELQILFSRLIYLINTWKANKEYCNFINQYFHLMRDTQTRRSILGALLIHICIPDEPDNLQVLRTLLNAISKNEYLVKFKTTEFVGYNFSDKFESLLKEIDKWQMENDKNGISQAFAYAKSSLLLAIYDRRFSAFDKAELGYLTLRNLLQEITDEKIRVFASFISLKGIEVFKKVFSDIISEQLDDDRLFSKILHDQFYLLNAYIIIQWYYLAICIREEDAIETNPERFIKKLISDVINYDNNIKQLIRKAFNRAANEYNIQIANTSQIFEQNKKIRKELMLKRDLTRRLIKMSE